MRVLIVGAGIGGLVAALCFHRAGHHVTIIEKASALTDVGAGIQISPNAAVVLSALDLMPQLLRHAVLPTAMEMREGISGRPIFSIPANTSQSRWSPAFLHVHRADLIDVLGAAVTSRMPDCLHLDTRFDQITQTSEAISAVAANGDVFHADLLIGADGIHSRVRDEIEPDAHANFTGNVAWRTTVPMETLGDAAPPRTACVWTGDGKHAVTYQLRGGTLANLVGVIEQTAWKDESWTTPGGRAIALEQFGGWHPIVTTIIERSEQQFQWALLDRPPMNKWCSDRLVLTGDACHPMLPFLAQGAAMAIEDAWVLAASVQREATLAQALAAYQAARSPRVQRVYKTARRNERLFHLPQSMSRRFVRSGFRLLDSLSSAALAGGLDWLYGYDPTQQHNLSAVITAKPSSTNR